MLKRLLQATVLILGALLVLPPLWYGVVSPPPPAPDLEPVGRLVPVLEGQAINVIEAGSGPAIVLAHGLPGSAYDWRALTRELAGRGFRVFAYDRAGYGHSEPRPDGTRHDPPRNVDELLALMDALELPSATLVGWSYGGVIAMLAAQQQPGRFDRLVLIGTGGPDSAEAERPEAPGFMKFLYSDPVLAWRRRVPPIARGLIAVSSKAAFSEKTMPDWWLPSVEANFARRHTVETYRGEMFTLGGDLDPAALRVPTLLLHGDDDRLAPVAIAHYLGETIPGAELQILEGGSHMLPVLRAPALADAISEFAR